MAEKNTKKRANAHLLPYPDFPLSPHVPTKRWYKRINGVRYHFGPLDDWQAAIAKYEANRESLYATGQWADTQTGVTVMDAANHFLTAKRRAVQTGELAERSFRDYLRTAEIVTELLGKNRNLDKLTAADFGKLKSKLAKGRKAIALGNEIRRTRIMFKYAFDAGLVDRPVRMGPEFTLPSKKTQRKEKAGRERKYLSAEEIRQAIVAANVHMRAMILLGVNAGLGNLEVAMLPKSAIDFERGILDYPRNKTGVDRRAPLWPETLEALQEAIAKRPEPVNSADDGLVFITRHGQCYVRHYPKTGTNCDSVGQEFTKLLRQIGIQRKGVGFYALRHVVETVGGETYDQPGVDRIMGHERADMASHYREWMGDAREDDRLRKITDHIHEWLFNEPTPDNDENAKKSTGKEKTSPKLRLVG